jgi:hypothetical protein
MTIRTVSDHKICQAFRYKEDSNFITSNEGILKKSREKMMVSLTMSAEFSKYPDKK